MPRKDGTGPDGSGKKGRGLGPCSQAPIKDEQNTQEQSKRGEGRGRCNNKRRSK